MPLPQKSEGWEYYATGGIRPNDVLPWEELPHGRSGVFRLDNGSVIWSWFNREALESRCCFHECDWCLFGLCGAASFSYDVLCGQTRRQNRQEFLVLQLEDSGKVAAVHAQPHRHRWPACGGSGTYVKHLTVEGVERKGEEDAKIVITSTNGALEVPLQHHMAIEPQLKDKLTSTHHSSKLDLKKAGVEELSDIALRSFADVKDGVATANIGQFDARGAAEKLKPFGWHQVSWQDWSSLRTQAGLSDDRTSVVLHSPEECAGKCDCCCALCCCTPCMLVPICTPFACSGCFEPLAMNKHQIYQLHSKGQEGVELVLTEAPTRMLCNCWRTDQLWEPRMQRGYRVKGVDILKEDGKKPCGIIIHTAQAAAFHVTGAPAVHAVDAVKRLLLSAGCLEVGRVDETVVEEEEPLVDRGTEPIPGLPAHWTNAKNGATSHFDQMVYVDSSRHKDFEELLQQTYIAKVTQDRPCPKAKCAKFPGGCPCNQPGGDPGLPVGYQVCRVIRIEDSKMWQQYTDGRDSIKAKRASESIDKIHPPPLTSAGVDSKPDVFAALDQDINECYVWHGTNVRAALSIAQHDFNINLAGDGSGTMYGCGLYTAESSTKADEYASDEPGGCYDGVFALLLCRSCMGKFYYTLGRDEKAVDHVNSGECDSTLGDRWKSVGTYRELVLYNNNQIYPEYIVMYKRVFKGDTEVPNADASPEFHMQVPVYWRNCHRNLVTDPFRYQVFVRTATIELLQRLVWGCTRKNPRIVSAKRIEHSAMWLEYMKYKEGLKAKLASKDVGKFASAEELDGDVSQGHVLTDEILKKFPAEDSMSFDNIESALNEHLLWHGSSKDAVESIVESDFRIPTGDEFSGKRFGQGAYFAENLDKSLSYTSTDGNGRKWILLCRVACGDFFYTQAAGESKAHALRESAGKDSVLANPIGKGPREFTIQTKEAVYPEFCLELDCKAV